MSFGFFDILSLRSCFDLSDGVTPKTYEDEPNNNNNELKSDLIFKDYSINFSRQVDMVTYDSLVGKKGVIGQSNAPQSISLNESSIRSTHDTALAFRGWASLVVNPSDTYIIGEGLLPKSPDGTLGAEVTYMLNPVSEMSQGINFTVWCTYKLKVTQEWGERMRYGCNYATDIRVEIERPQGELGKTVVWFQGSKDYNSRYHITDEGKILIFKSFSQTAYDTGISSYVKDPINVPPNMVPGNKEAGIPAGAGYPHGASKKHNQFPGYGFGGGFELWVNKTFSEGGWGSDATDTWTAKMKEAPSLDFNFGILTSD